MIGSVYYFDQHFGKTRLLKHPDDYSDDLKECKVIVLWGGEDISPSIYGQTPVHTKAGIRPSLRDKEEMFWATKAIEKGIPIIGICRGAQLLCAMDGGKLWQHVNNHAGVNHSIIVNKTIIGYTNSAHHQMMVPSPGNEILGVTNGILSPAKWGENEYRYVIDDEPEPEIVYFPRMNAIGIQGHPEWLDDKEFLNQITKQLVKEKLGVDVL